MIRTYIIILFAFIGLLSCDSNNGNQPKKIFVTGNPQIDKLTSEIEKAPNNPDLLAERGRLLYNNEAFDKSIEDLTKAISIDSLKPGYYHLLADVYMDYYQSKNALDLMLKAGKVFPKRIPTLLKLAEFQLITKQLDGCKNTISDILKLDNQEAEAYFLLGLLSEETGDIQMAKNAYRTTTELDSDITDAWLKLGNIYASENNPSALTFYNSGLLIDSLNTELLLAKGVYYYKNKKYNASIEIFKKIVVLDRHNSKAIFNTGLAYIAQDSFNKADDNFKLCTQIKPDYTLAYFYRAEIAKAFEDYEASKAFYETAIKLDPEFVRAKQGLESLKSK